MTFDLGLMFKGFAVLSSYPLPPGFLRCGYLLLIPLVMPASRISSRIKVLGFLVLINHLAFSLKLFEPHIHFVVSFYFFSTHSKIINLIAFTFLLSKLPLSINLFYIRVFCSHVSLLNARSASRCCGLLLIGVLSIKFLIIRLNFLSARHQSIFVYLRGGSLFRSKI